MTIKTAIETTQQISEEIARGNPDSLKELVRKGIESYQGSPAKKNDKLNEAVAHSLSMPNYDHLSAELKANSKREHSNFDIEIKEIESTDFGTGEFCFINGQFIDPDIISNESAGYTIIDREDQIERLVEFISEPIDRDNYDHSVIWRKNIMRDIILLEDETEMTMCDFIITDDMGTGYNKYASAYYNIKMFDEACTRILEENEDFAKTPRCPCCLSNLTEADSVEREYFNKHTDETLFITGKYETEDRYFVSGETLHESGWEYGDDSDTCAHCNEQL